MAISIMNGISSMFNAIMGWFNAVIRETGTGLFILAGFAIFFSVTFLIIPLRGAAISAHASDMVTAGRAERAKQKYQGKYANDQRVANNGYKGKYLK